MLYPGCPYVKYVNLSRLAVKWIIENFEELATRYGNTLYKAVMGSPVIECATYDMDGQTHLGEPLQLVINAFKGVPKVHIGTQKYFKWLFADPASKNAMRAEALNSKLYVGQTIPFEVLEKMAELLPGTAPDFLA